MSLQNRVDPWGALHAVAARGTLMGNRGGKFHRPDQTLGRKRWASHAWICCELHYKAWHHEPMGQGYTSLFFLDEVTALAAGHRPCFMCRRKEAKAFLGGTRAGDFDQQLHRERLAPKLALHGSLPDGAMIATGDQAYVQRGGRYLRWSFTGYAEAVPDLRVAKILTPPMILSILARGYQPRWHESAHTRDGT